MHELERQLKQNGQQTLKIQTVNCLCVLFVCLFVCVFVCVLVRFDFLIVLDMEIAIECAHVLAQCASDLCRSTAAQYTKIRDGTTIPFIKGGH